MYSVAEIGCGKYPVPRVKNADEHFLFDTNQSALTDRSWEEWKKAGYTPVVVSATEMPLPDKSVKLVIARNMFGCSSLEGDSSDSSAYKFKIIEQIGRTLEYGGVLLSQDEARPGTAKRFFEQNVEVARRIAGLSLCELSLDQMNEVAPAEYSEVHVSSTAALWMGTKI